MSNGRIVKSGDKGLALELEQKGYAELDEVAVSELTR
jgi:Fe-S cluster assembly ATPase SufC